MKIIWMMNQIYLVLNGIFNDEVKFHDKKVLEKKIEI